jgi:hypothetical protein
MRKSISRIGSLSLYQRAFLLFAFLAGFAFVVAGMYKTYLGFSSLSWPKIEGEVRWPKPSKWEYVYLIDGVLYTGSNEDFGNAKPKSLNHKLLRAKKLYPEGRKIAVYYSPNNPSLSVLQPGIGNRIWLWYLLGFFLISFSAVQFIYFSWKNK